MNSLNFINWPDFKCFLIKKLYWIKNNVNHTWISALCVSVCIRARFPSWSSITVINKVVVCQLSRFSLVHLSVTPWAVACQALLSVGILQARILEWVTSRAWAEEPGGLQPIGWQRVGHDWSDFAHRDTHNKSENRRTKEPDQWTTGWEIHQGRVKHNLSSHSEF